MVADGQVRVALSSGGEVVTQAADITEIGSQCIVSVRPEKMFIKPSDHAYDNQIEAKFLARHYVPMAAICQLETA